ncbi:S24/S26 family peptidase [Acholeplasma granularum]|uniref:S24/S26 family peptidase n=1 Tax=Acholeplasma granularum TaxID=264635 RepID=UPI0004709C72|nr:S24/S26 family peptidase [Acholeplasma granularum]
MKEVISFLEDNKEVEIIVTGNSMLPFYKNGETIVTLKKEDTYKKLDVVLFKYQNRFVLHRIIKIKNNTYFIKGDGSFRTEVVSKPDILGKVIKFTTKNKTIKCYQLKVHLWMVFSPFKRILLKLIKKT